MTTSSDGLFDTAILVQPTAFRSSLSTAAKVAARSKARPAPAMSASLWRHTMNECEAARGHGLVARSVCALLGFMSIAGLAAAGWQVHGLLSGNRLHEAVSAFLR